MNFQENLAEDDCAPCLEIKCKNMLINIVLKIIDPLSFILTASKKEQKTNIAKCSKTKLDLGESLSDSTDDENSNLFIKKSLEKMETNQILLKASNLTKPEPKKEQGMIQSKSNLNEKEYYKNFIFDPNVDKSTRKQYLKSLYIDLNTFLKELSFGNEVFPDKNFLLHNESSKGILQFLFLIFS